jgi:hypothetical protein
MSNVPADLHLASIGWTKSVAFAARFPKSLAKKNSQGGKRSSSQSAYSQLINDFGEEGVYHEIKYNTIVKINPEEDEEEEQKVTAVRKPKKQQHLNVAELLERPAVHEARMHNAEAFELLTTYLGKLPKASLVIEVSSRSGTDITQLVHKFPDLQFQPTEGSGGTSHGHFLFIEQNVLACEDLIQKKKQEDPGTESQNVNPIASQEEARCLKPRVMDLSKPYNWGFDTVADYLGCIFCVNTLQYEPMDAITKFLTGCYRILRPGGFVFLCGPFVTNGQASDVNFSLNVSLKSYVAKAMEDDSGLGPRRLPWGLPDSANICKLAKELGMDINQHKVGKEWLALVLRKPI